MSDEKTTDNIQDRLKRIQQKTTKTRNWKPFAIGGGAFLAGTILTAYAFVSGGGDEGEPNRLNLPTSQVSEFQDGASGLDGFTITRPRPDAPAAEPQIQPTAPEPVQPTVQVTGSAEIEALTAQIELMQSELMDQSNARQQLEDSMEQIRSEAAEKDQALQELERERMRLEAQLETQMQLGVVNQGPDVLEQQRLMELEERRQRQEQLRVAQMQSPMVAFRASGAGGSGAGGGGPDEGERDYDAPTSFLHDRSEKVSVTRSQVIANPANTIVQGTLIEATLETAISSALEGNVAANVSRDVWSMDMTQVLIPRGSKLYGRYSADVGRGQRRILIAWDRLITSDGQSVVLEGYGTDRIGRSGMTGRVNNHTLARFGSAAAVSIVGALPAVMAAAVERESNDEISRDTAERIGQGVSDSLADVMADYLDIPPTISVDQGAVVMVRLNNDIEMF